MSEHQGILHAEELESRQRRRGASSASGWRRLGWFGLALALMGLGDFTLAWYPPAFGSAMWEFGTVAATFSGLPLILLGFAGLVAAGWALEKRWLILTMGMVLLVFGFLLLAAYGLFLLDIPLALRATSGMVHRGIEKTIAKTSLLAITTVLTCFAGAIAAVRRMRRESRS